MNIVGDLILTITFEKYLGIHSSIYPVAREYEDELHTAIGFDRKREYKIQYSMLQFNRNNGVKTVQLIFNTLNLLDDEITLLKLKYNNISFKYKDGYE